MSLFRPRSLSAEEVSDEIFSVHAVDVRLTSQRLKQKRKRMARILTVGASIYANLVTTRGAAA